MMSEKDKMWDRIAGWHIAIANSYSLGNNYKKVNLKYKEKM